MLSFPEQTGYGYNGRPKSTGRLKKIFKITGCVVILVAVFYTGLSVGNGNIYFGHKTAHNNLPAKLDYSSVDRLDDTSEQS